jgi:uncharacterized membrane protein YphA (DoxX/SURF4 family)
LIFYKAIEFMNNMVLFSSLMARSHWLGFLTLGSWAYPLIMLHLIGGFLIAFGCLTRLACLLQLPFLLGAVVLVNAPAGVVPPDSSWWLSFIILLGLIFFLIEGGGPWSADRLLKVHPMKEIEVK